MELEAIARRYGRMRSLMRAEDVEIFEKLLLMGRKHSPEISMAGIDPENGFIISILLEILKLQTAEKECE